MAESSARLLRELKRRYLIFGEEPAPRKIDLIDRLRRRRLGSADEVFLLHEILCFLRAYPDDTETLEAVEAALGEFAQRSDLRRFARQLTDSGIAGTPIHYRFFWAMARWLAHRWPGQLHVDWPEYENVDRLPDFLHLLVPHAESLALDAADFTPRGWLEFLKGPEETDGTFLVRRIEKIRGSEDVREALYEEIKATFYLDAGPDTPSRTRAKYGSPKIVYQRTPLVRGRPSLVEELKRAPRRARAVSTREGQRLIDMSREAMITRSRDLRVFENADPADVRIYDGGDGLEFVAMGARPEHRLMLESVYGFLTLKNGVPIGYVLTGSHFNSVEVAYNVFETFRGAEAGRVYAKLISLLHHMWRADAFTIDPYQLGDDNMEALSSGAWWFYYKFGFRPLDPDAKRVVREELRAMRRDPGHRSTIPTLRKLAAHNVFYFTGRPREDVSGLLRLDNIGVCLSRYLADRFGSDRELATRTCSEEAGRLLGVRSRAGWTRGERLAWNRWCSLVMAMPGIDRWPREDRRELVRVIRAKGGRRESDYVLRFDRHRRLRRALLKMAATEYGEE